MSRDLVFFAGAGVLSLAVPGLLLSAPVFAEARPELGTLWGWGLALAAIVPSYVLLSRTIDDENVHRFHKAFMLGTMGRLLLCLGGTLGFHFGVADAPIKSFLLAFFLGWVLLTALELPLVLRRGAPRSAHREEHA